MFGSTRISHPRTIIIVTLLWIATSVASQPLDYSYHHDSGEDQDSPLAEPILLDFEKNSNRTSRILRNRAEDGRLTTLNTEGKFIKFSLHLIAKFFNNRYLTSPQVHRLPIIIPEDDTLVLLTTGFILPGTIDGLGISGLKGNYKNLVNFILSTLLRIKDRCYPGPQPKAGHQQKIPSSETLIDARKKIQEQANKIHRILTSRKEEQTYCQYKHKNVGREKTEKATTNHQAVIELWEKVEKELLASAAPLEKFKPASLPATNPWKCGGSNTAVDTRIPETSIPPPSSPDKSAFPNVSGSGGSHGPKPKPTLSVHTNTRFPNTNVGHNSGGHQTSKRIGSNKKNRFGF